MSNLTLREQLLAMSRKGQAQIDASKKLKDSADSRATRALEQANRISQRFEWHPIASIALFETQHCTCCGSETHMFKGYMTLMRRKVDAIERYVPAPCPDSGLAYAKHFMPSSVNACMQCVDSQHSPAKVLPPVFLRDYKRFEEVMA